MNACVAKPRFGFGFTNDEGKFLPLENFDQVLHSRNVHGFVIKFVDENNISVHISQTKRIRKKFSIRKFSIQI